MSRRMVVSSDLPAVSVNKTVVHDCYLITKHRISSLLLKCMEWIYLEPR